MCLYQNSMITRHPWGAAQLVQEALEHSIGTPRLCDMAIDKKKVVGDFVWTTQGLCPDALSCLLF